MKKTNIKGFVLLQTLIVTVFISAVLLFLFSQFSTLSRNYEESYDYNSVEDIYALNTVSKYILKDEKIYDMIKNDMNDYINITDCSLFSNINFCKKIFEYKNIDTLLVTTNNFDKSSFIDYDDDLLKFIKKINPTGKEKYRLIAKFKQDFLITVNGEDKTTSHYSFGTIRFGDKNE